MPEAARGFMSELPGPRRISVLSGSLVNQIAAGEVIERPSSVVKELVENSVDAQARRIEIDILAGGTRQILVRDDGEGIHPDDMELAVMRHSTSKVKTLRDLETVRSLGFRGEALSSIASVSDFTLTSRIASAGYGRSVAFDPVTGKATLKPAAHPAGTSVEVRNLFRPVPARRKFLRSDRTEFLHVLDTVKRLALGNFGVDVRLCHNGRLILDCPAADPEPALRIQAVLGQHFWRNCSRIEAGNDEMYLSGWLGNRATARNQSDRQYLYLNGRAIRDRRLNHAIRLALGDLVPASRYPAYLLHLKLDPAAVDVNVHPAKQEVRFKYTRDVHDFVLAAVKEGVIAMVAAAQTDVRYRIAPPVSSGKRLRETGLVYADMDRDRESDQEGAAGTPLVLLFGRYVIARYGENYRLADALELARRYYRHELRQGLVQHPPRQRPLLVPVILDFKPSVLKTLLACRKILARLGLALEQSGPGSVAVRTIPALLPDLEIASLCEDIADRVREIPPREEDLQDILIDLLATHAAMHGNRADLTTADVERYFRRISDTIVPVADEHQPGLWITLSKPDLNALINGTFRTK